MNGILVDMFDKYLFAPTQLIVASNHRTNSLSQQQNIILTL